MGCERWMVGERKLGRMISEPGLVACKLPTNDGLAV